MSDTLTLDALVEEEARAIAARRGWNWDLMPSFKDRFTRGCSHEECRDAARKWWGADGAPIAVFVEKPDCHDKTTQPTHPAHHAEG